MSTTTRWGSAGTVTSPCSVCTTLSCAPCSSEAAADGASAVPDEQPVSASEAPMNSVARTEREAEVRDRSGMEALFKGAGIPRRDDRGADPMYGKIPTW